MEFAPPYDSILEHIGGFGRYQCVLYIWFQLGLWVVVSNMGFMTLGAIKPKCPLDPVITNANIMLNISNETMLREDQPDCAIDFYSIAYEWNLVGDLNYVASFITSMQMVGVLLGTLIGGQLSDKFGRKYVFLSFFLIMVLSALGSSLSPSWIVYCVVRTVIGFGCGGVISAQYVFIQECLSNKWRLITIIGYWPFGFVLLEHVYAILNVWKSSLVDKTEGIDSSCLVCKSPRNPVFPYHIVCNGCMDKAADEVKQSIL